MRVRTPAARWSPWAIPLVVGVAGHRDLCPADVLDTERLVEQVLADLQRRHPSTPLLLLSPLAEGADRLAARVALRNGLRLVVPLPMPPEHYVADFGDAASREEFWTLLRAAHASFVAGPASPTDESERGVEVASRDRAYARAGAYVAQNCHLLLALWDGTPRTRPGGTSELVEYRLHGFPEGFEPASALDVVNAGPVCHIPVRRAGSQDPAGTMGAARFLLPGGEEADASEPSRLWAGELARLEKYNRDLVTASRRLTEKARHNADQMIPAAESSRLADAPTTLLTSCAASDVLATHYRDRYKRATQALFALAVLAVVAFASRLVNPVLVTLYPAVLLVGVLVYWLTTRTDLQNKHLDYRALAEGLRVQTFWHLAGITDEASEHYLRKQRTELEWIRRALPAARMTACAFAAPPAGMERHGDLILRRWVERQAEFYTDASLRDRRTADRAHRWAVRLFVLGLALAASVAVSFVWLPGPSRWRNAAVAVMGIAPALAAALLGYCDRMVLRPQAKRYEWMAALFERASVTLRTLLNAGDVDAARQLLLELGREALEENGDWLMGHRERPPALPVGRC